MRTIDEYIKILTLYDSGLNITDTAKTLDIPRTTVDSCIKLHKNLNNFLKSIKAKEDKFKNSFSEIIKYYQQDHLSVKQTMNLTNFTRSYINNVLLINNIKILSPQEYLAQTSKIGTDLNYFNEITPHAAYVLGALWGDGHICNNPKTSKYWISITCEDKDIVESVNNYFGGNHKIRKIKMMIPYCLRKFFTR